MRTHRFHKLWLKVTAIIIGSFGPIFFLGSMISTSQPAALTLDVLSWPIDGIQNYQAASTRFLSALTGGFLIGWSVCIWYLQKEVYDKAPEGVRVSVISGLIEWFLLDSLGSIASYNISNVFINVLVLTIAVGPLWRKAIK